MAVRAEGLSLGEEGKTDCLDCQASSTTEERELTKWSLRWFRCSAGRNGCGNRDS